MTPEAMKNAVLILPFAPADLTQLIPLDLEAFPDLAWQKEDFMDYEGKVAWLGEKVVGYIFYNPIRGYISNLVVRLGFRHHKIGSRLLQDLIKSHPNRRWSLEVAIDGPLGFYHAYGFRVTGLSRDFYGEGSDAYEMELELRK